MDGWMGGPKQNWKEHNGKKRQPFWRFSFFGGIWHMINNNNNNSVVLMIISIFLFLFLLSLVIIISKEGRKEGWKEGRK